MDEGETRVALVTGVGRRKGIGFAIARRLLADGLKVVIHSWSPADPERPSSAESTELASVVEELGGVGPSLASIEADFADPAEPARVIDYAVGRFGVVDVLIVNHAMSAEGCLAEISSAELDLAWAVNSRATVLLVQAYASITTTRVLTVACCYLRQGSTLRRWPTSCLAQSAREPCTR